MSHCFSLLEFSLGRFQDDPIRISEIHHPSKSDVLGGAVNPYPVRQKLLIKFLYVVCLETNVTATCIAGLIIHQWLARWHVLDELYSAIPDGHENEALLGSRAAWDF